MLADGPSEGGLRVCCADFVPRQARLLVTLQRNERKEVIRVEGTVVQVQQIDRSEWLSMGLVFDELQVPGHRFVSCDRPDSARTPSMATLNSSSS